LELLNSKGVVQKQLFNAKAFVFMGLLPDTYTLRLTLDANKNKKRDLPSYTNWQLGEVVLPPSAPVQVKANWEVEVGTVFE
jgi:hypothetical protein